MTHRRLSVLVLTSCLIVSACSTALTGRPAAAPPSALQPVSVPTVLILDGSGSMTEADAPGPRIAAAKSAALGLVDALPDDATIGLQTYGTTVGPTEPEKAAGCRDVSTLLPLHLLDRGEMRAAIDGVTPRGYTPMSLALERAVAQLPVDGQPQAVVLVSDGEETCDTPPCATAARLKQEHPGLAISTVGFKVDGQAADQLRCVADATRGLFVQATNSAQLAARLLATQNVAAASASLSADGLEGISLGMDVDAVHAARGDFPTVGRSGTVVAGWLDCDFTFVDGVLDSISPHGGGRTIDGVTDGTSAARVAELYGLPLAAKDVGGGDSEVVFDADPGGDAAYRMIIAGYALDNGRLAGTVKTIVLCRCKPRVAGPAAKVLEGQQVSTADYEYLSWTDATLKASPGEVTFESPSGNITCQWRTVGDGPLTCEIAERTSTLPPRAAECEEYVGWATQYVRLDPARVMDGLCVGGIQVPLYGNVLSYGSTLIAGEYGCRSESVGVTCIHFTTGRGFFASRERFTSF